MQIVSNISSKQKIASKPTGSASRFNLLIASSETLDLKDKQRQDAQAVADSVDLGELVLRDTDPRMINPTSKNEIIASHIENQIRAESGLSLRTHYGSVNVFPQKVSRLIDSKGNSIYFRSVGGMRDFGEGMNIMIQIRNGGIINSRMKIGDKAIGYPYNYPTQNPKTQ